MKYFIKSLPLIALSLFILSCSLDDDSHLEVSVPYGGIDSSSIHLVWKDTNSQSPKAMDYIVYVNGVIQSESSKRQAEEASTYNAAFTKSFYDYFTKERTGLEMVKTDRDFFTVKGLKPSSTYCIRVAAIDKDKKELYRSKAITYRTSRKPTGIINVRDYGASEKEANNSPFIQKAIYDCPKGGTVLIPEGTFISGSINLKSDMTLEIEGTLKASPNAEDYSFGFLMYDYYTDYRRFGLINADGATDIRITGNGTVDGNGWLYMNDDGSSSEAPVFYTNTGDSEDPSYLLPHYYKGSNTLVMEGGILAKSCTVASQKEDPAEAYAERSTTLILKNVDGLLIEGLTFTNPANHLINIIDSQNISITDITELSYDSNNGDGIGLICSSDCTIWNNFIDTGDDSIVFSAGVGKKASETGEHGVFNINIFGNYIHHGHGGIAFGSHTALGIHDINIHDNIFSHTDAPFRLKSAPANGGEVFNVDFYNNAIAEPIQAFTMSTAYSDKGTVSKYGAADKVACFHDIKVSNITVFGPRDNTIYILGKPDSRHYNLNFKNISFAQVGLNGNPEKHYDYGYLESVCNSCFENIKVLDYAASVNDEDKKDWSYTQDTENVLIK